MLNHELIEIHLNNSDLNLGNLAGIAKVSINEARSIIESHYYTDDAGLLEYPYYQLEKKCWEDMTSKEYDADMRKWMAENTND